MKIEWINPDCTEAIVTRGWFRPKSAIVYRLVSGSEGYDLYYGVRNWFYLRTGRRISGIDNRLARKLERKRDQVEERQKQRERQIADRNDWLNDWTDTGRFPKARLVERKS